MIIYDRLLKSGGGNFGNMMFQVSSLLGLAKRYGVDVKFPDNLIFKYFKNLPDLYFEENYMVEVAERTYKFDWSQWDEYKDLFDFTTVNVRGWLQSSSYWEHCKDEVFKAFEIKDEYVDWVRGKYTHLFTKPTIGISVRRTDYVNNESYHLLPIRYYIGALLKHFPDFRDNYNIVIFSDDIDYCKIHFACLENVFYAQGDTIEQHILGRQMDNFILANSTFSYWLAKLGEPSKVIVPKYLFAGRLLEKEGDITFWENEVQNCGWEEFDHLN